MTSLLTILSIGLVWLATCIHAYGIDSSCQDQAFIETSANAAINMARDALEAIDPTDGSERDPNVERLLNLLFRGSAPENDAEDARLIRNIQAVYEGVAKFDENTGVAQPGDDSSSANQVNIFCNLDRVQKHDNGKDFVDTDTQTVLKADDNGDHDLSICKTLSADLAVTWSPYFRQDDSRYLPSQITICPWFYQWAHSKELKQWTDLRVKSGLATAAIPVAANVWPFTPIDAIDLLDKVLLHEFTHTFACGKLDDVNMKAAGTSASGSAYGWKNAKTLAAQKPENFQVSARRNADSHALFGSGVRLLHMDPRVYIQDDGWVTTKSPKSKRDTPLQLQYKQTPAAFEGFVTSIREERAAATAMNEVYSVS